MDWDAFSHHFRLWVLLDTNTMGNSIDVEKNISSVVPTQGALVRANFDTRIGVRALITVTQGGKPVPFGSLVRENSTGITSMVGDVADTRLAKTVTTAILHSGIHARTNNLQHTPSFCGTKRTLSPGRNKMGSSRAGSNRLSEV